MLLVEDVSFVNDEVMLSQRFDVIYCCPGGIPV